MKRSISESGRKALSENMIKQNKLRKIDLSEEKLRKYYALKEKDKESVDYMYKELKTLINILGKEHFFNL